MFLRREVGSASRDDKDKFDDILEQIEVETASPARSHRKKNELRMELSPKDNKGGEQIINWSVIFVDLDDSPTSSGRMFSVRSNKSTQRNLLELISSNRSN